MRFTSYLLPTALLFTACGLPVEGEDAALTGSSEQELLIASFVDPRCTAQKVSETLSDGSGGPYLFVSCVDHPVNVYDGQAITVTSRDPFTGSLFRSVVVDTIESTSTGNLMVEITCSKTQRFHCPCGIGNEPVAGTAFPAFFCKSQPANAFP